MDYSTYMFGFRDFRQYTLTSHTGFKSKGTTKKTDALKTEKPKKKLS